MSTSTHNCCYLNWLIYIRTNVCINLFMHVYTLICINLVISSIYIMKRSVLLPLLGVPSVATLYCKFLQAFMTCCVTKASPFILSTAIKLLKSRKSCKTYLTNHTRLSNHTISHHWLLMLSGVDTHTHTN